MYKRNIDLSLTASQSCFLWGPRQTGKSTLLKSTFPGALYYDLLLASDFRRLLQDPSILRQESEAQGLTGATQTTPLIIDEVQKLPELLDEVQWLIVNRGLRFILCGSSARKLKRGGGNLLGGRAVRLELHPLIWREISHFSLERALNHGLLPRHYQADDPRPLLQAYVGDYLREEIYAEALVRNLPSFQRFLDVAALTNGEIVNYATIAREVGASAPTVKGYFEILADTLLGAFVPALQKRAKRRVVQAPKFYLFDVGVVKELTHQGQILPGSAAFGKAFEQFVWQELRAHASYTGLHYPIAYWRTSSGFEVDFILAEGMVAVEVKSSTNPTADHLKGMRAFKEEFRARRHIVVSHVARARRTEDGIEVLPWREFLTQLWDGAVLPRVS
jgi:predicted AAA+ superfamily ATPase